MDPAQTPPPPPPVTNIENTPPPPPAPPVNVVPPVPTTPVPPPPPPPGIITEKPKAPMSAGKIVGALVILVVLVGGLAAGIYLSQRNQEVKKSEAAGNPPIITGTGCSGDSNGISCSVPVGQVGSVYKFICSGDQSTAGCGGPNGATPINQSGPSQSESAGVGTPCNQTVQIDLFPLAQCDSGSGWVCTNTTGFAIWYTGACPVGATPTTPPSSGGSLTAASCSQGIIGSGLAGDVTQVHLYFDSGPEDYTSNGGDGHAAAKVVTPINNGFSYSLLDASSLIIAKEVGGNVDLGDGQIHRVRAFAINGSTNPELTGSNMQIDLHGRILGRIFSSDVTFQSDPNKQVTKCLNCSYNNALCDNAPTLDKHITIDGTNVQTVNQCNAGGPNYDVDLAMGTHSLVLNSGSSESVGWDCSSDNGIGCPAASGTGYTVTTTAATCAPIHVSYYVAGAVIPTATPTPVPGVAQCQTVTVLSITRGGTAVTSPTLAKIQKGDVVIFRGFATATNTTVTTIDFTLTKAGVAQPMVHVTPTLVSGTYQADYSVTIDQATSYSVSSSPTYN